jgi:hypothetical protein
LLATADGDAAIAQQDGSECVGRERGYDQHSRSVALVS